MRLALYLTSLTLTLTFGLAGCDGASAPAKPPAPAPSGPDSGTAAVPSEPVLDTVVGRSKARWDTIVDADWIQAYDFMTPSHKELESLSMYLRSKDNHEYSNPSQPRLLGEDKALAFVEVSVLWTPHHPILQNADNNPGDLTQQLDVVETWEWIEGDWYWSSTERQKDFLQKHPNLGG